MHPLHKVHLCVPHEQPYKIRGAHAICNGYDIERSLRENLLCRVVSIKPIWYDYMWNGGRLLYVRALKVITLAKNLKLITPRDSCDLLCDPFAYLQGTLELYISMYYLLDK